MKALQTMLGHKDASMSLDVYADLFPEDLSNVAVRMNEREEKTSVGDLWAIAS